MIKRKLTAQQGQKTLFFKKKTTEETAEPESDSKWEFTENIPLTSPDTLPSKTTSIDPNKKYEEKIKRQFSRVMENGG